MRLSPIGTLMPVRGFHRKPLSSTFRPDSRSAGWITHDGIFAISSLVDLFLPGTNDSKIGPTWVISISHTAHTHQERSTLDDVMRVIEAFEMPAWDEDNHNPGITRTLFCPVAEEYRHACDCKVTELVITDDDGYQWTTPTVGPCRGCEYQRLAAAIARRPAPCPIHGGSE